MNLSFNGLGNANINGKQIKGKSIVIQNGKVIVDGEDIDYQVTGNVNVTVNGHVENLQNGSGNITAQTVGSIKCGAGDITCSDVQGSIKTGAGNIRCGDVTGDVKTNCGDIHHLKAIGS